MQMEGLAHQGLLAATQGQVIKLDDDDDDDEDINDIDDTGDLDDVDAIVDGRIRAKTTKALTSTGAAQGQAHQLIRSRYDIGDGGSDEYDLRQ